MNNVKRYIPERVYEKIKTLNFKNKDHLYVVCDMIYRSSIYKKTDNYDGFQDIPSYYFRDVITKKEILNDCKNLLFDEGIIECDNIYSKQGGKALGYKFCDDFISKLIPVSIDKDTIKKRIIKNKNDRNNSVNEKLKSYKDYFINNFSIDYKSAIKYLNDWFNGEVEKLNFHSSTTPSYVGTFLKDYIKLVNKYNNYFISITAIKDKDLFFRKNKTNGRIDTNLTNLKSEFKRFIKFNGNLYQIDIVNSQPFILSLYLNSLLCGNLFDENDRKELEKYSEWTSKGIYYEEFFKTYFNKTGKDLRRKEIKDIMFCIFFSKNGSYIPQKKIFKSIFPFILSTIEKMKENKHNEFAINLQKIESEICIDIICQELDNQNIKYWTIHDAWLVDEKQIDKVSNIIKEQFKLKWGVSPELKIEKI